jgi:membrane protein
VAPRKRSWLSVLARTAGEFTRDQIPAVSAGVTFYALLALFPALAAFVSLYGLVADVDQARRQILSLAGVLPAGAITIIGQQLATLGAADHRSLGLAFAAGIAVSIVSANAGVKALIAGLNVAYEARETRRFVALNALSLTFTLGAIVFSVAAVAVVVAAGGASLVKWPLLLATATGVFCVLYRYGPARKRPPWRRAAPGAAVAAVGWLAMSLLFTAYVASFGHYNETYGSLGAVIGFMTWIWLSLNVVLFGAELNSELELTLGPQEDRVVPTL